MRAAIYGYGNLGRGVEDAISRNEDMELVAVFTRRGPGSVTPATPGVRVVSAADVLALAFSMMITRGTWRRLTERARGITIKWKVT